jgi:hypothetical protein
MARQPTPPRLRLGQFRAKDVDTMHECFANPDRNDGFGADSSPSRDVLVGALSALLRRSLFARQWSALDPLLPFKVGPMNGREARQSGLRLKAYIAPRGVVLATSREYAGSTHLGQCEATLALLENVAAERFLQLTIFPNRKAAAR